LEERMKTHAASYAFEEAQRCKEMLDQLQRYKGRSVIVHPTINNVDVFSFVQEGAAAFVNFVHVINGAIIHSFTIELRKKLDESPEELLGLAIAELRQRYNSSAPEIIVPFMPELEVPGASFTVPR
ncbi:MAG: excinuclease ABC subunit C, partial [bacterium]